MTVTTLTQPAVLMKNGTVFHAIDEKVLSSLAYNNKVITPASAAMAYALNLSRGEPTTSKKGKRGPWYWATTPLTRFIPSTICPGHIVPLQGHSDRPVQLHYTPYDQVAAVQSSVPTADPSFFETEAVPSFFETKTMPVVTPLFNNSIMDFFGQLKANPPNELTIRRAMREFGDSPSTTRAETEKVKRRVAKIGDGRNKAFLVRQIFVGGAVWSVVRSPNRGGRAVGATVIGFELWRRSMSCRGWLIDKSPALFLDTTSSIADRLFKSSYNKSWAYNIAECVADTLPVGGTPVMTDVLSPSVVFEYWTRPDVGTLAPPVVREAPYELVSSISEMFSSGYYGGQEKGELYSGMPSHVIPRLYEALALGTFGSDVAPHRQGLNDETTVTKIIETLTKYYPKAAG